MRHLYLVFRESFHLASASQAGFQSVFRSTSHRVLYGLQGSRIHFMRLGLVSGTGFGFFRSTSVVSTYATSHHSFGLCQLGGHRQVSRAYS